MIARVYKSNSGSQSADCLALVSQDIYNSGRLLVCERYYNDYTSTMHAHTHTHLDLTLTHTNTRLTHSKQQRWIHSSYSYSWFFAASSLVSFLYTTYYRTSRSSPPASVRSNYPASRQFAAIRLIYTRLSCNNYFARLNIYFASVCKRILVSGGEKQWCCDVKWAYRCEICDHVFYSMIGIVNCHRYEENRLFIDYAM